MQPNHLRRSDLCHSNILADVLTCLPESLGLEGLPLIVDRGEVMFNNYSSG